MEASSCRLTAPASWRPTSHLWNEASCSEERSSWREQTSFHACGRQASGESCATPPNRRDVVVFDPPAFFWELSDRKPDGEAVIKRIVAVEGDIVAVRDGRVYVNGELQEEGFTNGPADYSLSEQTVPPGTVFVLGDNRNASFDSHYWGFLPRKNIIGRALFTYWPPNKLGAIPTD